MLPDGAPLYAGIDVGTNAMRLLVAGPNPALPSGLQKAMLLRVPLRLGSSVFDTGRIGNDLGARLVQVVGGFAQLAAALGARRMRACGTSAFREAADGAWQAERASQVLSVPFEILDGEEEARLMSLSAAHESDSCIAIVDVGGGSTEVSIVRDGKLAAAETFRLGTVRLMGGGSRKDEFDRMRTWLKRMSAKHAPVELSGSGGNIRRINKILGVEDSVARSALESLRDRMASMPVSGRMLEYKTREDRAETIVIAMDIYLHAMRALGMDAITARLNVGLAHGIVLSMIEQDAAAKAAA